MTPFALALAPLVDPWTRQRHAASCLGKVRFATAAEAQQCLARWQGALEHACQVYACTACGWFHLGRYAGVAK